MSRTVDRISALRGELRHDESLASHTSWRVGGPARRFYRPADAEDLAAFLRGMDPSEPMLWLGLGSNLLVGDEGFAGTVVQTQGAWVKSSPSKSRESASSPGSPAQRRRVLPPSSGSPGWSSSREFPEPWVAPWP